MQQGVAAAAQRSVIDAIGTIRAVIDDSEQITMSKIRPANQAAARVEAKPRYRCAMCSGVFVQGWTVAEASAEAEANGFDPADSDLVCDDCYKLTPWGAVG